MLRNRTWYFLLYFISFCISTGIFHTVANAQESPLTKPLGVKLVEPINTIPTPTIFVQNTITMPSKPAKVVKPSPVSPDAQVLIEAKTNLPQVTPTIVPPTSTPVPTAIPTQQPTIAVVTDLESLFDKYSAEFGADKELLKKIARCESGFNPTSNNSGLYLGMYQFASGTWVANRNRMGLDPNPDLRTNAEEAIRTAAYMISKGGQSHWPNCH